MTADIDTVSAAAQDIGAMLQWPPEAIRNDLLRLQPYGRLAYYYVWWVMQRPCHASSSRRIVSLRRRYIYTMDSLFGLTGDARAMTLALDKFTCRNCGFYSYDFSEMTVDHVLPRSRNGGNDQANLQALCRRCNSSKGAMTQEEWESSGLAAKMRQKWTSPWRSS